MRKAICPGSFDPVTNGHIDIFERAARMYDELVIGVFNNVRKKPMFSVEERVEILEKATKHIPNVKVISFDGLLTEYMLANDIHYIVRGLRSVTDFEYEQGNTQVIRSSHPQLDTIFMLCRPEYAYISSSVVREITAFGGDISKFVPTAVVEAIKLHSKG